MDLESRERKLRNYMTRITSENDLEGFAEKPALAGLESLGNSGELALAASGIKKIITKKKKKGLAIEEMDALEAIILPRERPVLDIVSDTYHKPPPPWKHLGDSGVRGVLEAAIPSIGRIELPDHPSVPYGGTGFVVGEGLIMTNRHVTELFATKVGQQLRFLPGQSAAIDFKREIVPTKPFPFVVREVIIMHDGWDMALLRVDGLPKTQEPLTLSVADPGDLVDHDVAVIGYPAQDWRNDSALQNRIFRGIYNVKRLQPGRIMGRGDLESYGKVVSAVTHDSSTLGGNSGSAVVSVSTGEVVGLHFAGRYLEANFAVPAFELGQDGRVVDAGVRFAGALPVKKARREAVSYAKRQVSVEEEERELQDLDTTLITNPLLRHMQEDKSGKVLHSVIVEIDLRHPEGQRKTKDRVQDQLRKMLTRGSAKTYRKGKPYLYQKKSELGGHYVFADLTTDQIRELIGWSNGGCSWTGGKTESGKSLRREPIYKIWEDLETELYLDRSVSTVKADAARVAFGATGEEIVWAVIDSGVAQHDHFEKHKNLDLAELGLKHWDFTTPEPQEMDLDEDSDEIGHGTHVAGIIAGETLPEEGEGAIGAVIYRRDESGGSVPDIRYAREIHGVAPKCKIVSLKVVSVHGSRKKNGLTRDLMAALAHIREINGDGPVPRIHGVNISLGHDFDPQWFACGSSPVCRAVDALVKSGVSVVVAAGNGGYGDKDTQFKGTFQGGLEMTIRDPGNAMLAITVGATHGYMPHNYGVSYFSAKGPTGDGRLKPDLVAPGEKIVSCAAGRFADQCNLRGGKYRFIEQSGTSMAAPHVSGCIAAFLSLRHEFRTRPEQVKQIFLENATDLGRERYFQGHGLVDLMRAIQAV